MELLKYCRMSSITKALAVVSAPRRGYVFTRPCRSNLCFWSTTKTSGVFPAFWRL